MQRHHDRAERWYAAGVGSALRLAGIELSPDEFMNSGVLPNPTGRLARRHVRLAGAVALRQCVQRR